MTIALILGYGLIEIINPAKFYTFRKTKQINIGLFVVVWGVFTLQFLYFYFANYAQVSQDYWQSGYSEFAQQVLIESEDNETVWVVEHDERFYLWILLEPELSPQDILDIPSEDFFKDAIPGIYFRNPRLDDLSNSQQTFVVLGKKGNLKEELSPEAKILPSNTYSKHFGYNQNEFLILQYEPI